MHGDDQPDFSGLIGLQLRMGGLNFQHSGLRRAVVRTGIRMGEVFVFNLYRA